MSAPASEELEGCRLAESNVPIRSVRRGRTPHAADSAAAVTPHVVSASAARRLLLGAQGLLDDPVSFAGATPRRLAGLISRMGFVQVDTINTVGRAHHLIVA